MINKADNHNEQILCKYCVCWHAQALHVGNEDMPRHQTTYFNLSIPKPAWSVLSILGCFIIYMCKCWDISLGIWKCVLNKNIQLQIEI